MKILIFLQGTLIMHKSAIGKTREEIIEQVKAQGESVRDFGSYVPVGNAVEKLSNWAKQGAEIFYLSALTEDKKARGDEIVGKDGLKADQEILDRYGFPKGEIYHRKKGESYAQIAEKIMPDILIDDDCESIGGAKEMTITFIKPEVKRRIKSIVIKEYGGIDNLPDDLGELLRGVGFEPTLLTMETKNLKNRKEFFISPSSPFHFDGTFHKPSHYPGKLDDWESGKYWQTIRIGKRLFGLKIENEGKMQRPKIKASVFYNKNISEGELEKIKQEIIWRFDLNVNLSQFNKLAKNDKRFYPIFKKWLGMRNSSAHNLYELLIIAVLLQNATVRRTVQMTNILLDNYGTKLKFDGKEIFAIWLPEKLNDVSEQNLRDLKIGYRAKFIKRLSQDFAEGKIDEPKLRTLDQESAKKELMKLYGVGPETARILLFETCHQYNTFDHIAPWQQKIYSRLFYEKPLVSANKIRDDIKKQYGEYSMLAVHYIWEDIFWRRKHEKIDWLEKEIRL